MTDALGNLSVRNGARPENGRTHYGTMLLIFVALTFLLGGGARADVVSLLLLRPLAICMIFVGILTLRPEDIRAIRPIWMLTGAWAIVILLHLIPLPPSAWTQLPGRDILVDIFRTTDIAANWQPLTLDAFAGWNSLFALVVPAAALALTAAAGRDNHGRLIAVLCIIVMVSAAMGALQLLGAPGNSLYLYRITNPDSATGLFANRNHNAMFLACGFPLLAAWASSLRGPLQQQKAYGFVAGASVIALIPAILLTESRAGLLVGGIGLLCGFLIYRRPAQSKAARGAKNYNNVILAALTIFAAVCVTLVAMVSGSTAVDRLLTDSVDADLRFRALPHIWSLTINGLPFGWGAGSFVNVYRSIEPDALLSVNYLNHAHNDYLEIMMEFGLIGVAFILTAAALLGVAVWKLGGLRYANLNVNDCAILSRGWCGVSILVLLAIGSLFDYPARTPSLATLAAIAAALIAIALDALRGQHYSSARAIGRL